MECQRSKHAPALIPPPRPGLSPLIAAALSAELSPPEPRLLEGDSPLLTRPPPDARLKLPLCICVEVKPPYGFCGGVCGCCRAACGVAGRLAFRQLYGVLGCLWAGSSPDSYLTTASSNTLRHDC